MPHPTEHEDPRRPLSPQESEALADSMRAFGTGSRLRLLWAMLGGELTVDDLATATGLEASATSHQLRLLRQARLVTVRRSGRHAFYRLHDHHVAELLTAIRHHHEHVQPPEATTIATAPQRATDSGRP